MYPYGTVPMLRVLIPFCVGIVIQLFCDLRVEVLIPIGSFCFGISALYVYVKRFYQSYKFRWAYGVFLTIAVTAFGAVSVSFFTQNKRPDYFANGKYSPTGYIIKLTEPYHEKVKTLKAVGEIQFVRDTNSFKPATGKIMVYLEKTSEAYKLKYGDIIYTEAKPTSINEPQNPEEFNYKRFLGFHGIYHQMYLSKEKWTNTNYTDTRWLWDVAYKLQSQFVAQIKKYIPEKNEFAVCSALLIGFEDYLDQELIDAYSSSGALHVLSVSGLHVGLIYIFLSHILFFMDKRKWSLSVKNILLILFIWFYALLAGFAPSILRSAVMITMIIVGKWIGKKSYMLNTTLFSAFFLLCFNPFMLTEVGFQLSYLAVYGIVYLHQKLSTKIWVPNRVLNWILQLTSVSLCAQLMTFPLGLLYFHQFPNLFLISNLLVIPISTLLIYASIIATCFTSLPIVAAFFWKISYWLTFAMNWIVIEVDKLPFAIMQGISITIWETWLVYLIIAMVLWFVLYKKRLAIFLFFIFLIAFTGYQAYENYFLSQQQKLIVYSVKNKTAIDLINGTSHVFIADDSLFNDKSKIRFHIRHNWFTMGMKEMEHIKFNQHELIDSIEKPKVETTFAEIEKTQATFVKQKNGFTHFNNKLIFVPTEWLPKTIPRQKIKIDYLIITSRFKNKIEKLTTIFDAKKIIFDSSVANKKLSTMETTLKEMNVNYYVVAKQGAFIEEL